MHPGNFQYGTHRTTSYHTSTVSSRFDQYFTSAEFTFLGMWDGPIEQGEANHIFLSIFDSFRNAFRNIPGFAQSISHHAVAISYHNQSGKTKCPASFGYFSYTVETDHFLC